MAKHVTVTLTLTEDGPNRLDFADTYKGLDHPWYRFAAKPDGSVDLWADREGFEHLGRYFLKLARTSKAEGYHTHHQLELKFGEDGPVLEGPELTIGLTHSNAFGAA
jgi:hypothetical protein